jgi:hypothetical protein
MPDQKRRYERIDIDLPCRLFIPEDAKKGGLKFQAFTMSRNLGLGGVFVESTFLLQAGLELWVELKLPTESLAIRGQVAHAIPLDHGEYLSGMGIEFLDVDSHGRETLLRYFTPERYHVFYGAMTGEFPHLGKEFKSQDVSLILNLWEEWKIRESGGPLSTASGAPEPPPRRGDKRR